MIKLGELFMILELHLQGLSVSAIARQLGIDRKTVRAHIAKRCPDTANRTSSTPTKRDKLLGRGGIRLRSKQCCGPNHARCAGLIWCEALFNLATQSVTTSGTPMSTL